MCETTSQQTGARFRMAKIQYARVNENQEVILPSRIVKDLGLVPGDEIRVEPNGHGPKSA